MKKISAVIEGILLLAMASSSQAISLSIDPASQTVTAGSTVDAALVISGLGNYMAPSLGTFDLNVSFDPTILGFGSVAFGYFLGNPSLGEATTTVNISVPGSVNLFEVSLLEANSTTCVFCIPPYLEDLQPSSFILATLIFSALQTGTSALNISVNALGDAFASPLTADTQDGSVTVKPAAPTVPNPPTLTLLLIGLLGMLGWNKRHFVDLVSPVKLPVLTIRESGAR